MSADTALVLAGVALLTIAVIGAAVAVWKGKVR